MKVSKKWLEQYFDKKLDENKIEAELTKLGLEVEEKKHLGESLAKIVVGKIEDLQKHPDADKLQICKINIGSEVLQIVTGAANVYVGMLVPVALVGSKVVGGDIGLSKLRGVDSYGMLCSGSELGIDNSLLAEKEKEGILPLPGSFKLGESVIEGLDLDDTVFELGLTTNRADCYGIYNVAKEVALGEKAQLKPLSLLKTDKINQEKNIKIIKPELCHRYISRIVRNLQIKPSPVWFANILRNVGLRPINNLVDVTNYVMFELGHPMHAFDLEKLEGKDLIIDTAKEGEKFITIDGEIRELTEDMLAIKDDNKIVALAGVMGGVNSEVDENTKNILLEAANFNPASIRKTSRKLGLRSEASGRFERGLSEENTLQAMERACYLIELLEAGEPDDFYQESYPIKQLILTIKCKAEYINRILGMEIAEKEIADIFKALNFKVEVLGEEIEVTPSPHRIDIQDKIDLVEEVIRIYGYEKIPSTLPKGATNTLKEQDNISLKEKVKNQMVGEGLLEVITYNFIDNKDYEKAGLSFEGNKNLKIINPLSEKQSYMREALLPGILEAASRNFKRQRKDIRIFELGNTFVGGEGKLPEENSSLGVLISENKVKNYYALEKNDFYTIKGILERLLGKMGIDNFALRPFKVNKAFHPGRSGEILIKDKVLGMIGELHPKVLENYDIKEKIYYLEINLEKINLKEEIKYEEISRFPFVERDMAFIIPKQISYREIIKVINEASDQKVKSCRLFDIYEGDQIEEGYKSMAFSITYQNQDKTLTDEEVTAFHDFILKSLKSKLGAILR